MNDMKTTSDCCPSCCVAPPAPCKENCSLQRTPMRKKPAPAPSTQPPSIGYVNLTEGTFHTLAQLAATERNGDLIARGEIVEVCPVVRGAAHASPEVARKVLDVQRLDRITLTHPVDGAELVRDGTGRDWVLMQGKSQIRYLNEFERNFVHSAIDAARLPGTNGSGVDLTRCAAGRDGECAHKQCPQLRDGEPARSGRHCPLDTETED